MHIILAGNWHSDVHEEPMSNALKKLGCKVTPFKWFEYFSGPEKDAGNISFSKRLQRRLAFGPVINTLNKDLLELVRVSQPDAIFIYRGDLIHKETLLKMRVASPDSILVGYNNDDPFSPLYPTWLWRHFKRSIAQYDLVLAYRKHNLDDFRHAGAKRVELLRSWFIPECHCPLTNITERKHEVVFIGHYENDNRLAMMEAIARKGFDFKLFGHSEAWNPQLRNSPFLSSQVPVQAVWGEEYNKVLNQAKVALCFFSRLNRDTYTRRCFEIPASGTVMLAQYSDDLAAMFEPDKEAVYFSNERELLVKLEWLLTNEDKCQEIAEAGCKKVREAGHDVVSRMRNVLSWVQQIKQEKQSEAAANQN